MRKTVFTQMALTAMMVLTLASPAMAGEAFVTKARGTTITIDKGADDGVEVGLDVVIVRPPGEAVIHPLTGENLGSPEIELATGQVSKVSARAASVTLMSSPLLRMRSGDVARFTTVEEQMVLDQEMVTETAEKAAADRQKIRSDAGRLARNINSIQGTIRGLERAIRELRRYDDDVVKPQFNSINRQIGEMRDELDGLRTTVNLLNSVPIGDPGAEGEAGMSEDEMAAVRLLIQDEINKLTAQLAMVAPPPPVEGMAPPPVGADEILLPLEEEVPFYAQIWFIGIVAALGLGALGFFLYMKMAVGDDEEDDEDDEEIIEEVEEEDDDEIEVDVEEEDDIVVEETS